MDTFNTPTAFAPGSIVSGTQLKDALVSGVGGLPNAPDVQSVAGVSAAKVVDLIADKPEEKKTADAIKMCPACGVILSNADELVPTDVEKDRWLRHILGELRFTQTFQLFGGRMSVTFRSRTTAENDIIFNQLTDEVKEGVIAEYGGVMSPAYYTRMNRFMLTFSLVSITTNDTATPMVTTYPEVTEEAYSKDEKDGRALIVRAHDKITLARPAGQLLAILTAYRRFESLMAVLMRHSDDPDFWGPIVAGV